MKNNSTLKETALVILTKNNEVISALESGKNDERNILFRLFIAISILFSFDLNVIMKDFWKTIQLLSSEKEGKDFIVKCLEQSVFSSEKVEISSNDENGKIIFQKVFQSQIFQSMANNLQVLEGTYLDYKAADDPLVPPSIRNLSEKNFNVSVQSLQNFFHKLSESNSPLHHSTYDEENQDFDLVSLDSNNNANS